MSVPETQTFLTIILAVANTLGLILFGYDKFCAKKGMRRIPEAILLLVAALFGSAGCLAGMLIFRHKTLKKKFTITVPLLLVIQAAVLVIGTMGL